MIGQERCKRLHGLTEPNQNKLNIRYVHPPLVVAIQFGGNAKIKSNFLNNFLTLESFKSAVIRALYSPSRYLTKRSVNNLYCFEKSSGTLWQAFLFLFFCKGADARLQKFCDKFGNA